VVRRCMAEGLVDGAAFAVDASLIAADANKQRSAAGSDDVDWEAIARTRRSVREYLDTLDEAAWGAASETVPKFISKSDPAAQWTGAHKGHAFFAYADNYLIDLKAAIIVDVSDGNQLVAVPDLSALTVDAATAALRHAGLLVRQGTPAFSDTVGNGDVIDWSPRTQAAVGDTVTVVVSLGSRFVTMPDLVTTPTSSDQAVQQLVQLGIPASAITQTQDFSDTVPAGDVISTTPDAGGQADRAGSVALDVSKGPDVVPVPDVRGDSVKHAEAILQQAGLSYAVYGPPGFNTVVDQNPLPGRKVKRGSTVQLVAF